MARPTCLDCGKTLSRQDALRCRSHSMVYSYQNGRVGNKGKKATSAQLEALKIGWDQHGFKKGVALHQGADCWNYKGGKPNCSNCDKKLSTYTAKKCGDCAGSKFVKGQKVWNEGRAVPLDQKIKISSTLRGISLEQWKGFSKPENFRIRNSEQGRKWRQDVFERDDYTCQECYARGGKLVADHIKPFALYPDLRFDLDNGQTLCQDCHLKTDTYGHKTTKLIREKERIAI